MSALDHQRPSLDEQPLYASSGDRYAEVFLQPRPEMGLVEVYVLRWRDVPDADGLAQPIREALTLDHGWQEIAPGCTAHRYDAIVAGRAGVTIDVDLLAGVLDRARAQIADLAVAPYVDGPPLVPPTVSGQLVDRISQPTVLDRMVDGERP